MARYIDADKLYDDISDLPSATGCAAYDSDDVINTIQRQPSADVVEVVRCKNCRHWGGVIFGYVCRRFSGSYIRNETRADDFCSYGERK